MPNRTLSLYVDDFARVYVRLSQISGGKNFKVQVANLMRRLADTWPETQSDSEKFNPAGLADPNKRDTLFTAEEQFAVAEGLIALAQSPSMPQGTPSGQTVIVPVTAGTIVSIYQDAKLLGSGIYNYVHAHLNKEKGEAFPGPWDEDAALLNPPEEPAKVL